MSEEVLMAPADVDEAKEQAFALFDSGEGLTKVKQIVQRPIEIVARWQQLWAEEHNLTKTHARAEIDALYSDKAPKILKNLVKAIRSMLAEIPACRSEDAQRYASGASKLIDQFRKFAGEDVLRTESKEMSIHMNMPANPDRPATEKTIVGMGEGEEIIEVEATVIE